MKLGSAISLHILQSGCTVTRALMYLESNARRLWRDRPVSFTIGR